MPRTHNSICQMCNRRRPTRGFCFKTQTCAACQEETGDRPAVSEVVAKLIANYNRIPPWMVRQIMVFDQGEILYGPVVFS